MVDLSIGGWRLSKDSAADLAQDLSGVLEDASEGSHTVILHLFDNSIYKGEVDGELTDPVKLSRKYHIRGKLKLTDNADFKNLFGESGYIGKMGNNIRELGKQLRNLAHLRRLKQTKVLNPAVLMGAFEAEEEPDKLLKLFGTDPVHLTGSGYTAIATALAGELDTPHVVHVRSLSSRAPAPSSNAGGQRPTPRESWTAGTQVVARRNANWASTGGTGRNHRGGGNAHRGQRGGYRGRGGRGGRTGRWAGKRSAYRSY